MNKLGILEFLLFFFFFLSVPVCFPMMVESGGCEGNSPNLDLAEAGLFWCNSSWAKSFQASYSTISELRFPYQGNESFGVDGESTLQTAKWCKNVAHGSVAGEMLKSCQIMPHLCSKPFNTSLSQTKGQRPALISKLLPSLSPPEPLTLLCSSHRGPCALCSLSQACSHLGPMHLLFPVSSVRMFFPQEPHSSLSSSLQVSSQGFGSQWEHPWPPI